jgi:5'-nucleotidase
MTRAGFGADWNYVDGTPVMATLYGIDVLAKARWGKAPDLVLSGPNEGQNVGHIVISSGTVSNVQYAAVRGIPAIALSAGMGTVDNATLANPASKLVAGLTTTLLTALEKAEKGGRLIPRGITLNVNFPDKLDGAPWKMTQIGSYDAYDAGFVASLGKSGLPGVGIGPSKAAPTEDQKNDESYVVRNAITVSAMQIGYEAPAKQRKAVGKVLKDLVAK